MYPVCVSVFVLSLMGLAARMAYKGIQAERTRDTQRQLKNMKATVTAGSTAEMAVDTTETAENGPALEILPQYVGLHEINPDMVGWLTIPDSIIDYPVMQTVNDEVYYLKIDFYGQPNENGCLILDADSVVGTGTSAYKYEEGEAPSTNLIIHGHNMKSGEMFGSLLKYKDEAYGKEHNIIYFDSLYEEREYELIAVFFSQVYYRDDNVFKYYKFFRADTQDEFDDWYTNIKDLSLYDTGVTAEYGDKFITLSCCSYQTEDGRFVVVGKQVR